MTKRLFRSALTLLMALVLVAGLVLPAAADSWLSALFGSSVYSTNAEDDQDPIIDPQDIADYLFTYGCLPENFITKKEAQAMGWDSRENYLSDVAPGYSIGGDRFGNYEGRLPKAPGRQYYEADCYYTKGKRNAHRVVFSNDGLVYYTKDHYETFTQLFPSWEVPATPTPKPKKK